MTRENKARFSFVISRIFCACADLSVVALAYACSFFLRFDFNEPYWGWLNVGRSFVAVGTAYSLSLVVTGCYRLSWRRFSSADIPRYILAAFSACVLLTLARFLMPSASLLYIRPPYSITLICFFLSLAGIISIRWVIMLSFRAGVHSDASLIRRVERAFDSVAAAEFIAGKTIMVTGAGGSIGSEIVRQVAASGAKKILLVERSENALYEIEREMRQRSIVAELCPLMLDINDTEKMDAVFEREKPFVVLHAAAYKHVPMVEANPDEGFRNNTLATASLAKLAKKHNVARFVLISTDKAVNPVSVMGKTKREAEKAVMALNEENRTSFCAVRFGNVFGSSGSVVRLFREQISKRMPITVTHPEMRRYFMTVQEAVGLVLMAASRSERAIYTLDMGESVRILDLAESMILDAGYRPYVDVPIVFTGIRPGEKLFEELDISEKSAYRTDMAKIYITKV
jgi:FlaA1/EpsC-like NDP-sugar epimerase